MNSTLKKVFCVSILALTASACGSANAPIPTGGALTKNKNQPDQPAPVGPHTPDGPVSPDHPVTPINPHRPEDVRNKVAAVECELFETPQDPAQKWKVESSRLLFHKEIGAGFVQTSPIAPNPFATPDLPLVCTSIRVAPAPGSLWLVNATVKFINHSADRSQPCEVIHNGVLGTQEVSFKNQSAISYDYTVLSPTGGTTIGKSVILVVHPYLPQMNIEDPKVQHQYCVNYAKSLH